MATEVERLIVTLEAATKQYERALAKAQGVTVSEMRKIQQATERGMKGVEAAAGRGGENAAKAFKKGMEKHVSGWAKGMVGGIVGSLGFEALRKGIESVGGIGDLARDLSITTDALQTFQKAMQIAGGDTSTVTKAIANMQDELGDTESLLSRFFKANHIDTAKMSVEQLFQTILKLSQAMPAEDRLRLFRDGLKLKPGAAVEMGEMATHIEEAGKAAKISAEDIAKLDRLGEGMTKTFDEMTVQFANFLMQVTNTDNAENALRGLSTAFGELLAHIKEGIALLRQLDDVMKSSGIDSWLRSYGPFGSKVSPTSNAPSGLSSFPGDFSGTDPALRKQDRFIKTQATDQAISFLTRRTDLGAGRIEALQADFANRLANAMAAAEAATGAKGQIISAKRSYNEQADIYARSNQGRSFAAARPGYSQHEFGRAVDMAPGPVRDWIQAHAEEFGLGPASSRRGWGFDPPHVQLGGVVLPPSKMPPTPTGKTGASKTKTQKEIDLDYLRSEQIINELTDAYKKQQDQIKATQDAMDAYSLQLSTTLGNAVSGFAQDLMNGVDAGEAFGNMMRKLAAQLVDMAIQNIFSFGGAPGGLIGQLFGGSPAKAPGFAHGGQFKVGGSGGTDSSLVAFRATPGETVQVIPHNRLRSGRGGSSVSMGGTIINIEGNADERTLAIMERRIAQNNYSQRKALERDWGAMGVRYNQLRG